jgi:GNAT superfamily N-acetyltransferase
MQARGYKINSWSKAIMNNISLRAVDPGHDFKQLAAWFTIIEEELNTEPGLRDWYEKSQPRVSNKVAIDEQGKLLGFYWAVRDKLVPGRTYFDLFVEPGYRGQGIGSRLYNELIEGATKANAKILQTRIQDDSPKCMVFAETRGFTERSHKIMMELDLDSFSDQLFTGVIENLIGEGFQFTSMEEMGNTEEAQRQLYTLNETTNRQTLGTDGELTWGSFEDFQASVCQSDWYKPGGQKVVIDTATGSWAAMSAITHVESNDYAYNLFTGVYSHYRGRKLGQAVKVCALRYARDVLKVHSVRTHHNSLNLPMIAIDNKLGYALVSRTTLMEKTLG